MDPNFVKAKRRYKVLLREKEQLLGKGQDASDISSLISKIMEEYPAVCSCTTELPPAEKAEAPQKPQDHLPAVKTVPSSSPQCLSTAPNPITTPNVTAANSAGPVSIWRSVSLRVFLQLMQLSAVASRPSLLGRANWCYCCLISLLASFAPCVPSAYVITECLSPLVLVSIIQLFMLYRIFGLGKPSCPKTLFIVCALMDIIPSLLFVAVTFKLSTSFLNTLKLEFCQNT